MTILVCTKKRKITRAERSSEEVILCIVVHTNHFINKYFTNNVNHNHYGQLVFHILLNLEMSTNVRKYKTFNNKE